MYCKEVNKEIKQNNSSENTKKYETWTQHVHQNAKEEVNKVRSDICETSKHIVITTKLTHEIPQNRKHRKQATSETVEAT